jgi:hypothetical protein
VYAAPGQNNNQNTMRAAMPPNPSSTPPGQQQQPQMPAELSKGPQHLQQPLAGLRFFSLCFHAKIVFVLKGILMNLRALEPELT